MLDQRRSIQRFGQVLIAVLCALSLTLLLQSFIQATPYLPFLIAALLCAGYLGFGPACAAIVLGIVAAIGLSTWGGMELPIEPEDLRRLAVFILGTLWLGWQSTGWRRAREDLEFLDKASKTLAASLDQQTTLDALAGLLVPRLGDACAVALREATGALPLTAVSGNAEARVALRPLAAATVPGGGIEVHPGVTETLLARLAPNLSERSEVRALGVRSLVIVPLRARGITLGSVTLLRMRRFQRWRRGAVVLLEELAHRAALALDNARLYTAALRMKEALRQRAEELATVDRRKDVFLAVLAHEMCGPLGALTNLAEVMRGGGQMPEVGWDMMTRQLDVLLRLADDLLDVARISQGKVELRRQPVLLKEVLADALQATQPLLQTRSHHFRMTLPPQPLWILADRVRLAQVFINLLTNAAKYTDPGGRVEILAQLDQEQIVVRVKDSGIGMGTDLLPRVFDLFAQGQGSEETGHKGLGLGLPLARRLVELHGGSIAAHSAGPGCGSEFHVSLPPCPAPEPVERLATPAFPSLATREPAGRRILVVDDNGDAAGTLAMLLEMGGHQVCLAQDGPSALKLAQSFVPEVVLLDIELPGWDGWEVGKRLRESPDLANTVIIALTGHSLHQYRKRCQESGIDHLLTKPVDPEELRTLVGTLARAPHWRLGGVNSMGHPLTPASG